MDGMINLIVALAPVALVVLVGYKLYKMVFNK